ncbi:hypothetical protein GKZ90_0021080 [Flavobacterium sp. MC2016-06]|uniref:hypothetical protein n=1 Tax=Flavobacterium sp. MC2016-06 TaxID=2676308 RepID=UPI0012BABB41|nr:hypothetical protein [Flavobacterium sp. MC2016-06]MBU3860995.1 hypothetical protein [Flavobacterium sp. MC2016-06]
MAINYSGGKKNPDLENIQAELYADSVTFRDRTIDIIEGFKSGTDVYESKTSVAMQDGSTDAVTATGDINMQVQKSAVALKSIQYSDVIDDAVLFGTRFEKSMSAGAFNQVSDEFDKKVLIQIAPAIGEDLESKLWNGATTATKTAVAASTLSASFKATVAAMPVTLFDSIPVRALYNDSNSKVVAGAGVADSVKITGTTITSANIAAEYSKLYAGSPDKVINATTGTAKIFAPLAHRQLIKIANNAVGAAQQVNFLVEGSGVSEKISYNGIEIEFHPLVSIMILTLPEYLKVLVDLVGDMSYLEIDKMANGAQKRYIKNKQSIATWVTNQRYITIYG